MSGSNVGKPTGIENDAIFGIPDTGVSVSWDFSAGCATSDKVSHFKPVTPKPIKYSSSSRIYRRRCLTSQMKLPTEGDEAFAEQMLSLVSVNRKNILKNCPGVSPKGRSPRGLRSKIANPSPLRDDNFLFLLNDSLENDDMIRCSQITEAALKEEEKTSPLMPKKEGRPNSTKRLALGRSVGSPLSRKRLLDAISSSQKSSPLTQSNNQQTKASTLKIKTDTVKSTNPGKSTDQCNNNVQIAFGTSDDNLFINLDDCPKIEPADLPKKSLSLNRNQQQAIPGVTPIVTDSNKVSVFNKSTKEVISTESFKENVAADSEEAIFMESLKKNGVADFVAEDLDDDMDFDLELSPHLLDLLDGHVDGPTKESASKVQSTSKLVLPCAPKETVIPHNTSVSTNRSNKIQINVLANSERVKSLVSKQSSATAKPVSTITVPVSTTAKPVSTATKPVLTKTVPVSTATKPASATSVFMSKKASGPTLSQSAEPKAEKLVLSAKGLTRHASAPDFSSHLQPIPKPSARSVQTKSSIRKCTPEEIERKRQEALKKLKKSQSK